MKKQWQQFGDECPKCGAPAEVLTSAKNGYAHDGDNAQCVECGLSGIVCCDGDQDDAGNTTAWVLFNDYEDEDI